MRYLLDTHAFLWLVTADPNLSRSAEQLIRAGGNRCFVSMTSLWEIAIKVGIGKLSLNAPYAAYVPREIANNNLTTLPITLDHTTVVATLPHHHRDPFDRLLIAQAIAEGMPIVSADASFDAYGVTRLW
jgi:PIN domain nuclease of toxin-antitoxin system